MNRIAPFCAGILAAFAAGLFSTGTLAQTQVVRFLHNETDPPSIEFFNTAIKEFEAANPDIKIEMEAVSTDGRLQKLLASIKTKSMPEIFKLLPEERFDFARRGYLVPLDDLIDEIGRSNYVDGSFQPVDGKIYDIPYTLSGFSVFFERKDMLEKKGLKTAKNWDEIRKNAAALTGDGNYGFIFPAGKNRMTSIFLSTMIWSAGGTYFDKDLNVTFNNPGTIKALAFLKEMAKFSPPGVGSYSYSDMINVYLTGTIGQDIYAPRLVGNAADINPQMLAQTSASPMPKGPSGVGVKFMNPNSFALASPEYGAKNTAAGRKFLKFIVTGEQLKNFSLTTFPHFIPPLKQVQEEVIKAGLPKLGNREDLARLSFDTSSSLNFETEAGAEFKDGKVIKSGISNPLIGSIVARGIPAEVVQRVVLQDEDPAKAAAWGHEQMQRLINELKKK